jgi:hypothetical protein
VSKKTEEGNSSLIQESISSSNKGQEELIKSLELDVRIMPTPDNLQSAMSYTIVGASTAASLGGIGPFLTTGSTGGAPNWPASSEGHQIM